VSLSLAPNITCPVMLMLGDRDTLNPIAYGQRFVNAAPNAHLVVFEGTGHPVHNEQWASFRATVSPFLQAANPQQT
jgi:pimeloyl-ACP methyl ester carboxylesterase